MMSMKRMRSMKKVFLLNSLLGLLLAGCTLAPKYERPTGVERGSEAALAR